MPLHTLINLLYACFMDMNALKRTKGGEDENVFVCTPSNESMRLQVPLTFDAVFPLEAKEIMD